MEDVNNKKKRSEYFDKHKAITLWVKPSTKKRWEKRAKEAGYDVGKRKTSGFSKFLKTVIDSTPNDLIKIQKEFNTLPEEQKELFYSIIDSCKVDNVPISKVLKDHAKGLVSMKKKSDSPGIEVIKPLENKNQELQEENEELLKAKNGLENEVGDLRLQLESHRKYLNPYEINKALKKNKVVKVKDLMKKLDLHILSTEDNFKFMDFLDVMGEMEESGAVQRITEISGYPMDEAGELPVPLPDVKDGKPEKLIGWKLLDWKKHEDYLSKKSEVKEAKENLNKMFPLVDV